MHAGPFFHQRPREPCKVGGRCWRSWCCCQGMLLGNKPNTTAPPRSPPTFPSQTSPSGPEWKWPQGCHTITKLRWDQPDAPSPPAAPCTLSPACPYAPVLATQGQGWAEPLAFVGSLSEALLAALPQCGSQRCALRSEKYPKDDPNLMWWACPELFIHCSTAVRHWGTRGRAQGLSGRPLRVPLHHQVLQLAGSGRQLQLQGPYGAPTTPAVLASWRWTWSSISNSVNKSGLPTSSTGRCTFIEEQYTHEAHLARSHYYYCDLVAQSCPTLCDPVDCRLPGSAVHGILQARVLKWGAIS